jgi:nicotinate-nucleotide adenylyltransferase
MLNTLPTWHQPVALIQEARLLIMARPGWTFDWDSLGPQFQALREQVVQVPQIDISATEIRQRVRTGLPIDYLTPPAVCRYIHDRKLYR